VTTDPAAEFISEDDVHLCCGGYREHRYSCLSREWPATATPEIRRQAVRGDSIAPANAKIEDLVGGLDDKQRKQLTKILSGVWGHGHEYGSRLRTELVKTAGDWERIADENDNDSIESGEAEWAYRANELRSCASSLRMLAEDAG
jgi:hypothetical protein